jgi:triacylglycerol lipase
MAAKGESMGQQRLPIVLVHGIARFDVLRQLLIDRLGLDERQAGDTLHYFKGIKGHLERFGFEVHHANVDFAASVDRRAHQLSEQVAQVLAGRSPGKVHIIAHSMGGLDTRHMIVDVPGMAERVATVTTIGTPHSGTAFADFGLTQEAVFVIDGLRSVVHVEGFKDLTTTACRAFNDRARHAEASNEVSYRTYASSQARDAVFLPLQLSWSIIHRTEGDNDGLVSVTSQRWTPTLIADNGRQKPIAQNTFPVEADHLNQVAWWDPQELASPLSVLDAPGQAARFEDRIRNVYLEIARAL